MFDFKAVEAENNWKTRFELFEQKLDFKENILNNGTHLDFGCGFGAFAKILAEKYPCLQVCGIDADREKIQVGCQRYKLPNLHLIHSNEVLGNYSSCTAFVTLHEIVDSIGALRNLYEHLNNDGRMMIYDFRKTSKAKYREWYEKGKREHCFEEEYQKHNRWTAEEFKRMCEDAGFETVKVERYRNYWLFYIGKKAVVSERARF
jgi:cyclopropane fatty-acyl-phospholipid synthase-like methyltransferase